MEANKLQSMTFYEKVKAELTSANTWRDGLCRNSKTFKDTYSLLKNRIKIMRHAKTFHAQHNRNFSFCVEKEALTHYEDFFLFHLYESWTQENFLRIRLEFIEWCIENNLDL